MKWVHMSRNELILRLDEAVSPDTFQTPPDGQKIIPTAPQHKQEHQAGVPDTLPNCCFTDIPTHVSQSWMMLTQVRQTCDEKMPEIA